MAGERAKHATDRRQPTITYVAVASFSHEAAADGFRLVRLLQESGIEVGLAGTRGWTISVHRSDSKRAWRIARKCVKHGRLNVFVHPGG
jgi:hypothetical protein